MNSSVLSETASVNEGEAVFTVERPQGTHQFLRGLVQARKQSGRKAFGVLWDLIRLSFAKRRMLDPERYFHFRLFEYGPSRVEEMKAFLDHLQVWDLNHNVNSKASKDHAVDQKQYLEAVLRDSDIPVVDTQAILRSSGRAIGKVKSGKQAAIEFFREHASYPVFGKPVGGSLSLGAASIEEYLEHNDSLRLSDGRLVSVESFVGDALEHYGEYGYMVQTRLVQHTGVQEVVGSAISCVRLVTCRNDDGDIEPLYAVWKMSAEAAVADNLWRDGNLCAAIDVDRGTLTRCRSGEGVDCVEIENHPTTGVQLIGLQLPRWGELVDLAMNAASLIAHTDLIGWDIAVTDSGPVVVEGNTSPDHGLYQLANQQGVLSAEFGGGLSELGKRRKASFKAETKEKFRKERQRHTKHILANGFKLDR